MLGLIHLFVTSVSMDSTPTVGICAERPRSAASGEQREPVVRYSVKFDARRIENFIIVPTV